MSFHSPQQVKTVFLTGASGVVGQALLARLDPSLVICLVHRSGPPTPGVRSVAGDISLPLFGLGREQFNDLARRIDCIVHAAAVTDFIRDEELVYRTNVHSLKNIFELAEVARAPLYHISTAFIRPPRQSENGRKELPYTASKREAERLVRASGLPYVIIRPSIVIGDSRSGEIARFQGFHSFIGNCIRGVFPIVPASPESYVDFVPQDVVAEVIAALIDEGHLGAEYWITSGDEAFTMRRIATIVEEYMLRRGEEVAGLPRFVTPDVFDRLIKPVFLPVLPQAMQKRFTQLYQTSSYICIDEPFPTSLPELQQRLELPPLPDNETALLHGLEYWSRATEYLNPQEASAQ